MRTLLRASVTAVTAATLLATSAVSAHAAPAPAAAPAAAAAVTVTAGPLVLEPGRHGHTGSVRATIHNDTAEPFLGSVLITEPLPATIDTIEGASGCTLDHTPDQRAIAICSLDAAIAPGGTGVVTVRFRSPARPRVYPQIAPQHGTVTVEGSTADFAAIFRSVTGSVRNPRPYAQSTAAALTVTARDVTLTRRPDGTFAGRVPVSVRNGTDAPHAYLSAAIVVPPGVDYPSIEPPDACVLGTDRLPVAPGENASTCGVAGGQLAERDTRAFDFVLTAPAGTPTGLLGTGTTTTWLDGGPATAQTDGADVDTFTITVAG
ncbi:hypothetical protein ACQP2F_21960 [Actinoplanes sp. CA-030573]|uniref:hypothetical protein n=1 Tax=Actinoplanes sp. CA-030573 TaxID=3239898 RepID=UPI003D9146C0